MKKKDFTVKVNLELPKEVIKTILNKGLSRFEEAKYLLLAHYYYHQHYIVAIKDMNQYLGIKDVKGREMRLNMNHWNIITPIESAKIKRNNKGQFFKKGYDIYQPIYKTELIKYTIISDDARALIGKYSGELLSALNVIAEKATVSEVKKYNSTKEEYKKMDGIEMSNSLKEMSTSILKDEEKRTIEVEKVETPYEKHVKELKNNGITQFETIFQLCFEKFVPIGTHKVIEIEISSILYDTIEHILN